MKSKMIAVAVAGMLVGCGSGGSFESSKGQPLVHEELPAYGVNGPSTIREDRIYAEEAKGSSLIQEQRVYAERESKGPSLIQGQTTYVEHESKGPSLIQGQRTYVEAEAKGPSLIQSYEAYAEETDKGDPAFNEVEELAVCENEHLQEHGICNAAVSLINSGISEAKTEFDKDPQAFQLQSKGIVITAEETILRVNKANPSRIGKKPTYAEVIEYLVKTILAGQEQEDTFENRYTAAGYAIATYYYVRGIPEDHIKTWNPGLCADKGFCGDEYLKYQWN